MIEYLLTIPWLLYLFLRTKKALHMLQQNLYNDDNRYIKWMKNNFSKIMLSYELIQLLLIPLILLLKLNIVIYVVFGVIYLVLFIINRNVMKNEKVKKPLVVTARVKRIITTMIIVYGLIIYFIHIRLNVNYLLLIYFY